MSIVSAMFKLARAMNAISKLSNPKKIATYTKNRAINKGLKSIGFFKIYK